MSDQTSSARSVQVCVEAEALRLLNNVPVSIEELARAIRLEARELVPFLADPASMRPLVRLRVAVALRNTAARTPNPTWSAMIADALWDSSLDIFRRRVRRLFDDTMGTEADQLERRFADLLFEELGPELIEHLPSAPGTPNR